MQYFQSGVFPLFYRLSHSFTSKSPAQHPTRRRILVGAIAASILGLQMGAFGVVLETLFSGISELPFVTFLLLMQPIHLAIGIVEGLVTAAVVTFIWKARPEILNMAGAARPMGRVAIGNVLAGLLVVAARHRRHAVLVCFGAPGRAGVVHVPYIRKGKTRTC